MSQPGMRSAISIAAIAVSLFASAPASAQDAGQGRASGDQTIVVSAKEPGGNQLDYPGSIDSIGVKELDARQLQDLSNLSYARPNVSLDPIGTFKGVANFAIRGLGVDSSIPSIDPAVGLFVDGVYQGVNAGDVFDTVDIAQVDILRGPQGVAFGRNTTGGAVLVKTADPTWDWEGHASVGYEGPVDGGRGTGMLTTKAVVSGPLSDNVAIRIAALHSHDGGYFINSYDGSNFGKADTTLLRGGAPSTNRRGR